MTATQRYEGVRFVFINPTKTDDPIGDVLFRSGEMVIDIHDPRDPHPCLIKGVLDGTIYRGEDTKTSVKAKWTEIDGEYLGIWVEGDYEYLFRFRLP